MSMSVECMCEGEGEDGARSGHTGKKSYTVAWPLKEIALSFCPLDESIFDLLRRVPARAEIIPRRRVQTNRRAAKFVQKAARLLVSSWGTRSIIDLYASRNLFANRMISCHQIRI